MLTALLFHYSLAKAEIIKIHQQPAPTCSSINNQRNNKAFSKVFYIFFIVLHLCFSLDFGFAKETHLKNRIFLKLFTCIKFLILILISIYLVTFNASFLLPIIFAMAEYVTVICILFYHDKFNTFSAFLKNIYLLIGEMEVDFQLTVLKMIICLILCVTSRCTAIITLCLFNKSCTFHDALLLMFCKSTVTFSIFIYFAFLYLVYVLLKKLEIIIQQSLCTISRGKLLYKYLVDAVDKAKYVFQRLVSINRSKWPLFP